MYPLKKISSSDIYWSTLQGRKLGGIGEKLGSQVTSLCNQRDTTPVQSIIVETNSIQFHLQKAPGSWSSNLEVIVFKTVKVTPESNGLFYVQMHTLKRYATWVHLFLLLLHILAGYIWLPVFLCGVWTLLRLLMYSQEGKWQWYATCLGEVTCAIKQKKKIALFWKQNSSTQEHTVSTVTKVTLDQTEKIADWL